MVELDDITVEAGEHVVHFYEGESQLAQTAGGYLCAALEGGSVALVIATEEHRRLFSSALAAAGLDPVALSRDGRLILLDAADTMARITRAGAVDRDGFRTIVGSVVRRAAETGRPVDAYGEMVALLWEAGDVLAAIELEEAWNDLAGELPFALLCAYRSESAQEQEQVEACARYATCTARSLVSAVAGLGTPGRDPRSPPISPPSKGRQRPRASLFATCSIGGPCARVAGGRKACGERAGDCGSPRPIPVFGRDPPTRSCRLSGGARRQRRQADDPGQPDRCVRRWDAPGRRAHRRLRR